jgi:hypothetical protein
MGKKNGNRIEQKVVPVLTQEEQEIQEMKEIEELEKAGNIAGIDDDVLKELSLHIEKTLVELDNKGLRKRAKTIHKSLLPDMEKNLLFPVAGDDYKKFCNTMIQNYKVELSIIAGKLKKERKDRTEGYIKHLEITELSNFINDAILSFISLGNKLPENIKGKFLNFPETMDMEYGFTKELPTSLINKVGSDCPLKVHYAGMREKLSDDEMLELGEQEVINQ